MSVIARFEAKEKGRVVLLLSSGDWVLHDCGENIKISPQRSAALLEEFGYSGADIVGPLVAVSRCLGFERYDTERICHESSPVDNI